MARIRSIHPGQARDSKFARLSFPARQLCLLIRNEADDYGVFVWDELEIKMTIFPADNIDVAPLLQEMLDQGHVRCETVDGKRYGYIKNFCEWQSPRKPSSLYPVPVTLDGWLKLDKRKDNTEPLRPKAPPVSAPVTHEGTFKGDEYRTSTEPVPHQYGNSSGDRRGGDIGKEEDTHPIVLPRKDVTGSELDPPEFLDRRNLGTPELASPGPGGGPCPETDPVTEARETRSESPENGQLGAVTAPEELGLTLDPEPPPKLPKQTELMREFVAFYEAYPRKQAKGRAERAYLKARKIATREQIMRGVEALVASEPDPQYIPHPATWLNGKQWADQHRPKPMSDAEKAEAYSAKIDAVLEEADRRDRAAAEAAELAQLEAGDA